MSRGFSPDPNRSPGWKLNFPPGQKFPARVPRPVYEPWSRILIEIRQKFYDYIIDDVHSALHLRVKSEVASLWPYDLVLFLLLSVHFVTYCKKWIGAVPTLTNVFRCKCQFSWYTYFHNLFFPPKTRSLSYVMVTSSFAFFLLAACYLLIDVWNVWNGSPCYQAGNIKNYDL